MQSSQVQHQHTHLGEERARVVKSQGHYHQRPGTNHFKKKRIRWHLEKQTEDLAHEIAELETKIESALVRAIECYPHHQDARLKLSLFHAEQYRAFRKVEDYRGAARHLTAIHQYGFGEQLSFSPHVPIDIDTYDERCWVYLCPLDEEDRRLMPTSRRLLGTTPFAGTVPPGHHMLQLESQSRRSVTCPYPCGKQTSSIFSSRFRRMLSSVTISF